MQFRLKGISHTYGKNKFALKDISLEIKEGEIVCLLGESGSGKSTLLRLIAGFEQATSGTIELNDKILSSPSVFIQPENRNIGMVFQDYSLFPHLSVEKNISFGCKKDKTKKVDELLQLIQLKDKAKNYPHELSGGQQQRVAIARSLAADPGLLLLDEPFSSLDDSVKTQVRNELLNLLKKSGKTTMIVTHDINDCVALADKMAVMRNGEIIQTGVVKSLYDNPKSLYVARLFGKIIKVPADFNKRENAFVRPENISLKNEPGSVKAKVTNCRFIGKCHEVTLLVENSELVALSEIEMEIGIFTQVKIDDQHLIFFK